MLVRNNIQKLVRNKPIINDLIEKGRVIKVEFGDVCIIGVYAPNDNAKDDVIKDFY